MNRNIRALTAREERSWQRLGNVFSPGNDTLPRYEDTQAVCWVPEILLSSTEEDEQTLRWAVLFLGALPIKLIQLLLSLLNYVAYNTQAIGALPRLLLIGLKGVIHSSYYAGIEGAEIENSPVYKGMDFQVNCHPINAKNILDSSSEQNK